jgi:hypothetical protein
LARYLGGDNPEVFDQIAHQLGPDRRQLSPPAAASKLSKRYYLLLAHWGDDPLDPSALAARCRLALDDRFSLAQYTFDKFSASQDPVLHEKGS